MVGSSERGKEAVGIMALHDALRSVCLNSHWTYSVFWTIRPRPRVRGGGSGCKVGDDNGSLMLMWEDGFCRGRGAECLDEMDGGDHVRKAFSKMSIQLYNYGEGLMGKVASDKCHKWVFKEPTDCEPNISNYWQSSFDALPQEWTDQFESGIQIAEDLHFVLRMRHTFESLGHQSGYYLSQLFSSTQNNSSSSTPPLKQPSMPPPPLFNWGSRPFPSMLLQSPETDAFLLPHPNGEMTGDHENDVEWPNGLSFFNALTGRTDEAKMKPDPNVRNDNGMSPNESLSLDTHSKRDGKFNRSFNLPARSGGGMYSDVMMETFLE